MEAGEREYTYLSLARKYIPFFDVFRAPSAGMPQSDAAQLYQQHVQVRADRS